MARPESLQEIRDFVEDACRRAGCDRDAAYGLVVAVDEACANVIEHGYAGREPGRVGISLDADGERIRVVISDRGRAFDPRKVPAPELDADWRARRIGGLGWHLIRQFVDEVGYESDEKNGNRLTLVKRVARSEE